MRKKLSGGLGIPSFLMIFIVLCMTVFAVLAFITARGDSKLSVKNEESVRAYYSASAQAQKYIAEIDSAIFNAVSENRAEDYSELSFLLEEALKNNKDIIVTAGENSVLVSFRVTVDDTRAIDVRLTARNDSEERYRINTYKLVYTGQWDGDDQHIEVWEG